MNDEKWFSANLRFVVLVEPWGGDTAYDRLFMLKAKDFASAFDAAISIGRAEETEYRNSGAKRVIWRFMQLMSLDVISSSTLDRAEVHSQSVALTSAGRISFDQQFSPELSRPIQTI
jgi:hypothetical protein